jgi:hypothetical protein
MDDHLAVVGDVIVRSEQIEVPETRHGGGDGDYTYDSTIVATEGRWTGAVGVLGIGSSAEDGTVLHYDLELTYDTVEVEPNHWSGSCRAIVDITIEPDGGRLYYAMDGEIAVDGDVRGDVAFSYALTYEEDVDTWVGDFGGLDAAELAEYL